MYQLNDLGEYQSKLILDRINQVEKHFSEISAAFAGYARKQSKIRDKSDELAKVLKNYADQEKYNLSTKRALEDLTKVLVLEADQQDLQVARLEECVVGEFTKYDQFCRNSRDEVKETVLLRDKKLSSRRQLDILRQKKLKKHKNAGGEKEMIKSNMEVAEALKEMEQTIDSFEKHKLEDTKSILTDFILINLKYHSQALELYTSAFQDISDIDEKKDLQQFKKLIQKQDGTSQGFFLNRFRSQSMGTLSSMFNSQLDKPQKTDQLKLQKSRLFSQSSVSLHSLDSDEEVRRESKPICLSGDSIETRTSDSADEDSDQETEEEEEDESEVNKPKSSHVKATKPGKRVL